MTYIVNIDRDRAKTQGHDHGKIIASSFNHRLPCGPKPAGLDHALGPVRQMHAQKVHGHHIQQGMGRVPERIKYDPVKAVARAVDVTAQAVDICRGKIKDMENDKQDDVKTAPGHDLFRQGPLPDGLFHRVTLDPSPGLDIVNDQKIDIDDVDQKNTAQQHAGDQKQGTETVPLMGITVKSGRPREDEQIAGQMRHHKQNHHKAGDCHNLLFDDGRTEKHIFIIMKKA